MDTRESVSHQSGTPEAPGSGRVTETSRAFLVAFRGAVALLRP